MTFPPRYTGDKQGTLSLNGCVAGLDEQCPKVLPSSVLIGRTEYNVMMYDSNHGGRWNITYFDYSSNNPRGPIGDEWGEEISCFMEKNLRFYEFFVSEFVHFTDSSDGRLVTVEKGTGLVKWEREDLGSPVVGIYT